MELIIDNLIVKIPEELVQERMYLMHIDRQKVHEILLEQVKEYKECFLHNKKYNENTFEQTLLFFLWLHKG